METIETNTITNLSNIIGDVTSMNKLVKLLIKLIATDVHQLKNYQKQYIDIGIGKLIVVNKVNELEWNFVPSEELEQNIQKNKDFTLSPIEEDMLKSIVYKIVTKYQELL